MKLKRRYKTKRESRTFWVVNSGRCASKSIYYILNEAQNVDVYHEPIWTQGGLNMWSPIYREYALKEKGHFGKKWLKDMTLRFVGFRGQMIWQAHEIGKIYGETSPIMSHYMPVIKKLYLDKGAKFIHLVRHPYHQVRSQVHFGWWSPTHDRAVGVVDWAPGSFDGPEETWRKMDVTMKNLWHWVTTQKRIIEQFADIPEPQKMILKLEDFTVPKFKEIYEWLGLTPYASGRIETGLRDEVDAELEEELFSSHEVRAGGDGVKATGLDIRMLEPAKKEQAWTERLEQQLQSKRHKFPEAAWMLHWVEWDNKHREVFEEMSDGLMEYFGYEWDY